MEKKTRKNISYRINRETVCTYEFDDTPPFLMDDAALDIAIEISMLEHLSIVGELHVARKQYLTARFRPGSSGRQSSAWTGGSHMGTAASASFSFRLKRTRVVKFRTSGMTACT